MNLLKLDLFVSLSSLYTLISNHPSESVGQSSKRDFNKEPESVWNNSTQYVL